MYTGLGEDIAPMSSGPLDMIQSFTADWDWHQWALAAIGGYLVVRTVFRGGRRATETVSKKVRKVGGGFKRRRRALRTVFTG